jgi:pseudouridine-5'-phosphate glycosidase
VPPRVPHDLIAVAPEVRAALAAGRAVVALESTIVTHGMPHPDNLAMAREVETIVRDAGATPATIAVAGGKIRIGLEDEQIAALAALPHAAKVSRRDLAALLVRGETGGTTVAATMQCAALAGITVFATGGIGGVHRGAETTFDISADLEELATTPVAVVCAGAKSILDIAKTLEYLETHGVPVIGYRTDAFPAFFARTSGHGVDYRFDDAAEIARVMHMQRELQMPGGVLIANPIPEIDALDFDSIGATIAEAIADAEAGGIGRKELTPFLLARINERTGGRSLAANIALVKNNARLAAEIAVQFAQIA